MAPQTYISSPAGTNPVNFNEPGRVRLEPVLHDARNAEKLKVVFDNFVIFRHILTKLCSKVYIL